MKYLLPIILLCTILMSCQPPENQPEPHLELGQKISFVGGKQEVDYVVIGYRDQLESNTEDIWNNQNYLVFVYLNNNDEVKQGIIHRNAILKK